MSRLLHALLIISALPACIPICTQAHMQMSSPYPLRSPLDPANSPDRKDYDMANPLRPDGSDFSCKHYQHVETNPQANVIKATYQAGETYNLTLSGTATHMGGSCQISISYDNGVTFKVLQSIIGGCPLTKKYDFTIPSYAPASDSALLSWSWFNIAGNREMYQNCARIQILGNSNHRYRRTTYKRQASIDDLPDMFVCNVGNGCSTIERREVVFPNPGSNVIYGQNEVTPEQGPGLISSTPSNSASSSIVTSTTRTDLATPTTTASFTSLSTAPFPFVNSTTTGASGTGSTTYSQSSLLTSTSSGPVVTSTSRTTTTIYTSSFESTKTATFTTLPSTSTTRLSSAVPTATFLPGHCVPNSFVCNSPTTFSQCVPNSLGTASYIYMGPVAPGMQCVDGKFVRQNAGSCTPNGSIFCKGTNAFYICDQGGLIDMGPVAPGTKCVNGVITAA